MIRPARVQLRRAAGWRLPSQTITVARPTRWGNPFRTDDVAASFPSLTDEQRAGFVVNQFRDLMASERLRREHGYPTLDEIRAGLAGKDLACWCPPGSPCHADVLIEVANGLPRTGIYAPPRCAHCGEALRERPGSSGRYRWERADTPDTAIFGSGSECPENARGHEPANEEG